MTYTQAKTPDNARAAEAAAFRFWHRPAERLNHLFKASLILGVL